jgi:vacuolar protein sorting-associated protein 18
MVGRDQAPIDRSEDYPLLRNAPPRQPITPRTLLSSNFANPIPNGTRAANAVGRNILTAGDKLRELIVPDTLVALVTAPVGWIPGIGLGGGRRNDTDPDLGKKTEKLREELENTLASNCPLCESVVVGLDKPFIQSGEEDTSWDI